MQSSAPKSSNNVPIGSVVFALPREQRRNREIRSSVMSTRTRNAVRRTERAHFDVAAHVEPARRSFASVVRAWIVVLSWAYWAVDVALLVFICLFCDWSEYRVLYRPVVARAPNAGLVVAVHRTRVHYWGLLAALFAIGVLCRGYTLLRPARLRHYIGYASNPYRWCQYMFVMPLVAVTVAIWCGVYSVWFCALVVALQSALGTCMLLTEYLARPYGPDTWLFPASFRTAPSFGSLIASLAMLCIFLVTVASQELALPAASVVLLAGFVVFTLFVPLCQLVFTGVRPVHFVTEELLQGGALVMMEILVGVVALTTSPVE